MDRKQFLYAAIGAACVAAALAAVIVVSLWAKGSNLNTGGFMLLVLVAFFGGGVSWLLVVSADSREGSFGGMLETVGVVGFAVTTWVVLTAGLPDLTHFVADRFSPYKAVEPEDPPIVEFTNEGEITIADGNSNTTVLQLTFPTDKAFNDEKIVPPTKDVAEIRIWRQDAAKRNSFAWRRVGPATAK